MVLGPGKGVLGLGHGQSWEWKRRVLYREARWCDGKDCFGNGKRAWYMENCRVLEQGVSRIAREVVTVVYGEKGGCVMGTKGPYNVKEGLCLWKGGLC